MEAMTRRRVLCGLLLASVVLACFAGWLVMASGPRVTAARFDLIQPEPRCGHAWGTCQAAGGPPVPKKPRIVAESSARPAASNDFE
jgi:hypothetical protein